MRFKAHPFPLLFLIIAGCTSTHQFIDFESLYGPSAPKQRVLTQKQYIGSQKQGKVSYYKDIKPIFDSRCVVCHGCYDAPCQLKLSSFEGLDRGATKQKVYDAVRMSPVAPTRLFTDATSTADWRKKNFYPVLNERSDVAVAGLNNSVLAKVLKLKRAYPLPESGKLSKTFELGLNRDLVCPTVNEFAKYKHDHPLWGMPYAMPGLSLKQEYTLLKWLKEGAKVSARPPLSKRAVKAVEKWERYLNGTSKKQQIVFRYIYEHLFSGHIHFKGHPDNEFFRLVRSKTAPGQPIKEISTARPFDDPGVNQFYYRLRRYTATIIDKTHFVYELSDQKMQRFDELFFLSEFEITKLLSYQPVIASHPLEAFQEIPLSVRYKFLLDDAGFFISGFIKGPVCRGQVALNSIRDQFWVFFSTPESKYPEESVQFLIDNSPILSLPGAEGDKISLFGWSDFDALGKKYLKKKDQVIDQTLPDHEGFDLSFIWDGDGHNQNAALTVFRHFDSATVTEGFIGDTPLTAWFVDYPILERLHYLLVAGFNVYGSAGHQLASRTYMDILRQDTESNFLRLMPAHERQTIYDSWYMGMSSLRTADPLFSINHETGIDFKTTDYKKELFDQIRQRMGPAAGAIDTINQCHQEPCRRANTSPVQQQVDDYMRMIAKLRGLELDALPEMSLVRVKTGDPQGDLVYTLLVNKALSNVSMLVREDSRRLPENDTITVFPGFIGSYPNFFFSVDKEQLGEFVELIRYSKTEGDAELLYSQFGIRRSNPEIWLHLDWFNSQHKKYRGLKAGLLDMNRYQNL